MGDHVPPFAISPLAVFLASRLTPGLPHPLQCLPREPLQVPIRKLVREKIVSGSVGLPIVKYYDGGARGKSVQALNDLLAVVRPQGVDLEGSTADVLKAAGEVVEERLL